MTVVLLALGFSQLPLITEAANMSSDVGLELKGYEEVPGKPKPKPTRPVQPGNVIKGFLPQTGEAQILWVILLGVLIVLISGSYYYLREHRKDEDHEKV